jgi:hypothetical protein
LIDPGHDESGNSLAGSNALTDDQGRLVEIKGLTVYFPVTKGAGPHSGRLRQGYG